LSDTAAQSISDRTCDARMASSLSSQLPGAGAVGFCTAQLVNECCCLGRVGLRPDKRRDVEVKRAHPVLSAV
jgi:hypothetical protein